MKSIKRIRLGDFLTEREIELAQKLKTANEICRQVIKPSINRINQSLGQKNDPMYLAYAVEYVVTHVAKNIK